MKLLQSLILSSLVLLAMIGVATAQAQPKPPLTNASIVKLVRAGFKEKTIIALIATSPTNFDLSPEQMIELKRNRVSEKIIIEMVNRQEDAGFATDNFDQDAFFNQSANNQNQKDNPKNGNSTDIFGSKGGGKSETRSRGGTLSSSGDTETVGSATVRIIRPPTEAGGGAPKLEKSPALTNDAIIELVEAGFSEGTIIRRIERSPVDFNLSPEKLADLRKHRVSDKILSAMKAATGEDTNNTKTGPGSNGMAKPK
ncbi:MAG TPA: hypothetical protein VFU37_22880 [Pyrinomonadaceae bacterium]|nr:hypothetical protein [Pyrinomonadaceae bacterium]